MSNPSCLFGDTITLYNYYKDNWYRTVLDEVQWTETETKTIDSDGEIKTSPSISITVPYRDGYVPDKEYNGQGFTFGLKNLDIVVLGECDAEITDEYTITNLKRDYPHTATIYSCTDNTLRPHLKHWRVSADESRRTSRT